jgi:hypothetical protein
MKNLHILPTDKPSRLYKFANELYLDTIPTEYYKKYNIYITSDEALPYDDSIFDNGAFYHRDAVGDVYIITKHTFKPNPHFCKRIILTTDQDLFKDGVQAIDDEFLEWFVKNPSCEEVEVDKGYRGMGLFNYKLIIPKEELKTSEEWQKQFPNTKVIDPDGWDRQNFQYSWFEEKITLIEYTSRLHRSTVKGIIPKEETKQETQGYICPQTQLQCDDECCVSAEDCHIEVGFGVVSDCEPPKEETLEEVTPQDWLNELEWKNKQETFIKPDTIDGGWLSPIPAERQWQEEKLREIFGHYPTASPKWQYMNGLIQNNLDVKEMYSEEDMKQFAFDCVANFLSNNDNKVEMELVEVIIDRNNKKFEQFKKK